MAIPTIPVYTGGVANPDGSQDQQEFTTNMFNQLSYEAALAPSINDTVNEMNSVSGQVDTNAAIAQNSADAAQSAANFEGEFVIGVTSAEKGKSYSYSGEVWLCLQNTTTTPSQGASEWKLSVGEQYVTEAQNDIVGGSIFKGSNGETVEDGDVVEPGITHLRVLVGGKPTIVAMTPARSGLVDSLTPISATIGGGHVDFRVDLEVNASTVSALKSTSLSTEIIDYYNINASTIGYYDGWGAMVEPQGGCDYVITTRERVRASKSDEQWEPDGYGDHYLNLGDGLTYVAVRKNQLDVCASHFGATQFNEDNSDQLQSAVDFCVSNSIGMRLPSYEIPYSRTLLVGGVGLDTPSENFGIYGNGPSSILKMTSTDSHAIRTELSTGQHVNMSFKSFKIENNPAGTLERHCLTAYNIKGLNVDDMHFSQCRGDGLYIRDCEDVLASKLFCENTYRQGVAVTRGSRIVIDKVRGAGSMINLVDIEPNLGDTISDLTVNDVKMDPALSVDLADVIILAKASEASKTLTKITLTNITSRTLSCDNVDGLTLDNITVAGVTRDVPGQTSLSIYRCANVNGSNINIFDSTNQTTKLNISECADLNLSSINIDGINSDPSGVLDILNTDNLSISRVKIDNVDAISLRARNVQDLTIDDLKTDGGTASIALLPTASSSNISISNFKPKNCNIGLLMSGDNGLVELSNSDLRGASTKIDRGASELLSIWNVKGIAGVYWSQTLPTAGEFFRGDKIYKELYSSGGKVGWVCIQSGVFGISDPVFKEFGDIQV